MSDQRWKSVRGAVRRWLAGSSGRLPRSEAPRPPIRFGPETAESTSAADWLAAARQPREHPSSDRLRDREGEWEQLQDEISRLAHPDLFPPIVED